MPLSPDITGKLVVVTRPADAASMLASYVPDVWAFLTSAWYSGTPTTAACSTLNERPRSSGEESTALYIERAIRDGLKEAAFTSESESCRY